MERQLVCPDCPAEKSGKPKLYFNTIKGVGWCHRCHKTWFARDGILVEPGFDYSLQGERYTYGETTLAVSVKEAREYLEGRGVSTLQMVQLGIEYRDNQLYFPITSPSPDILPAWMKRGTNKDDGWYFEGEDKKNYCFGLEAVRDSGRKSCVLVEGIFDVLTPGLHGYAIALLGTRLHDLLTTWLEMFVETVYVWLDPGVQESYKAKKIVNIIRQLGLNAHTVTWHQEPGDCKKDQAYVQRVRDCLNGKLDIEGKDVYIPHHC